MKKRTKSTGYFLLFLDGWLGFLWYSMDYNYFAVMRNKKIIVPIPYQASGAMIF